ncbi:MAG: type IA DNA topoisomerase [Thermoprotei archaeon]|nr:MAG: type IA DNA topoisomerase [Thermoprotei archaeon]
MKRVGRKNVVSKLDVLIVAEKDSVARAFAKYLAEGSIRVARIRGLPVYVFKRYDTTWASFGLKGHVLDFDFEEHLNVWDSVDPRVLFFAEPKLIVREESRRHYEVLRSLAKLVTREVILALDADAEGECIAFEVMDIVRKVNPFVTFKRAWFSAVTKNDILRAINNLREPDPLLASKAKARMIVDLTIGAAFTRLLTLSVRKRDPTLLPKGRFLSYGPCQSPVLFLVVQRALERENFKPKKYYMLKLRTVINGRKLELVHERIYWSRDEVDRVLERIRGVREGIVVRSSCKLHVEKPPIPLNTVELEKRASKYLNIRSKLCMEIAERLYQEGYISYPRTETTIYPKTLDLRAIVEELANVPEYRDYALKILSAPRIVPTQGDEDDRAHPPIYPTKAARPSEFKKVFGPLWLKAWKLYDFIVRHFLATLSKPAILERRYLVVNVRGVPFKLEGTIIVEKGYLEIYPYERIPEFDVPMVKEGSRVPVLGIQLIEDRTKPPDYLSEAELLSLMRKYGIGTDATMQDHIHTNVVRGYFIIKRGRCIPTPLGKTLALTLYRIVPEIVSPEVRGRMEREFSRIVAGEKSMESVVHELKREFLKYFDRLREKEGLLASELISALRKQMKEGVRLKG